MISSPDFYLIMAYMFMDEGFRLNLEVSTKLLIPRRSLTPYCSLASLPRSLTARRHWSSPLLTAFNCSCSHSLSASSSSSLVRYSFLKESRSIAAKYPDRVPDSMNCSLKH
ncbi:hypothetical protein K1719_032599 [Acacia pycnantha]|nr:hypothetical protein K1719_032599 [Acacia pycnantha]